jgi:hypothetical protein
MSVKADDIVFLSQAELEAYEDEQQYRRDLADTIAANRGKLSDKYRVKPKTPAEPRAKEIPAEDISFSGAFGAEQPTSE